MQSSGMGREALEKLIKKIVTETVGGGIVSYPVGSYYFTSDSRNPSEILGGGTWEKLESGRFLMAAGDGYAVGAKGGEATHKLTTNEMPSHSHSGSSDSAGSHTHTVTVPSSKKTVTINGMVGVDDDSTNSPNESSGCTATQFASNTIGNMGQHYWDYFEVEFTTGSAAQSLTTSNKSGHTHSITVGSAGSGAAHNNMPPYIAVNIWRRMA